MNLSINELAVFGLFPVSETFTHLEKQSKCFVTLTYTFGIDMDHNLNALARISRVNCRRYDTRFFPSLVASFFIVFAFYIHGLCIFKCTNMIINVIATL